MKRLIDVSCVGEPSGTNFIEGEEEMIVPERTVGPVNVKILHQKDGRETVEVNGEDISTIITGYDIQSRPGDLQRLILYLPIGSLTIEKEQ
jgi:hypothetical protein